MPPVGRFLKKVPQKLFGYGHLFSQPEGVERKGGRILIKSGSY